MSGAYTSASYPASALPDGRSRRAVGLGLLMLGTVVLAATLRPHWSERDFRYSEPVRAQVVMLDRDPAVLGFRYIHRGRLYAGDRFAIGAGSGAAGLNHRHGDWITVKIDPRHPERSVARPGLSPRDRIGIVAAVALFGAAALLFLLPGSLHPTRKPA
ncbi:hypothetical protein HFP89_13130 [Wenzhouxiangella sp. XN79A]|uniref:hypothetical protein n=1 Tax=Wenzhouxiangella sp. XN79A TaxID=2724193 RepID=UPI00144ABF25|nr:hypothetical protein [Wenzhouxiangella sp. XN79A]NKI36107.1 hypothetical protein [Wenzhouxiangella sp. XN79A]